MQVTETGFTVNLTQEEWDDIYYALICGVESCKGHSSAMGEAERMRVLRDQFYEYSSESAD